MADSETDLERYERLEELGSGGLGTVYKGRHRALDREVAIKEISDIFEIFADLERDEIVGRFEDIVQAQARISHPAVTQILDLSAAGEVPFVVSEYARSGSLRRLADADEVDRRLRVVLKYFVQLLHGLQEAHRHDLVHGNIKPENVLLDDSGNAKLSDFGLSTLIEVADASNQVHVGVGAVAYLAPELFDNPNAATEQSDIYALGILFYELLTGKVPGRRSPMPSDFYDDIPAALDDIFDRMTLDGRDDRYGSIGEVLEAFYGSDDIVALLDRRSGVVFLRDPLEFGDRPFGDESGTVETDADSPDEAADTIRTDAAPVDDLEEAHQSSPPADDVSDEGTDESTDDLDDDSSGAVDEAPDEDATDAVDEGLDEDSSDAVDDAPDEDATDAVDEAPDEDATDAVDEGLDEDSSDAVDEDASDAPTDGELADESSVQDDDGAQEAPDGEEDSKDDEVLDKLDQYGDMFEE